MVKLYPGVAQLVARMVRVHEAVGSTPATRTSKKCCNLSDYSTFSFFEYTRKYTLPILAFKYARLIYVHTAKITAPQHCAAGRFLSAGPVGLGLPLIEVKETAIYPNASMVRGHVPGISL